MKAEKVRRVVPELAPVETLPPQDRILDYLRPYAAGEEAPAVDSISPDHVLARRFLEEGRLCWFDKPGNWNRLMEKGEWTPVSTDEVHHQAISFLEQLSDPVDATVEALLAALGKKPDQLFQRAKRIVRCARWFSDPPAQITARSEEFCRQWLTRDKGNQRAYIASADLWRLYEVTRSADSRPKRDIQEDFASAIRAVFRIGRSNNVPNPKTGKQRRGWWGLRWARPLPEGFNDSDV